MKGCFRSKPVRCAILYESLYRSTGASTQEFNSLDAQYDGRLRPTSKSQGPMPGWTLDPFSAMTMGGYSGGSHRPP